MRNILVIATVNFQFGGIETYLWSALRRMDLTGLSIDWVINSEIQAHSRVEELRSKGINLIPLNLPVLTGEESQFRLTKYSILTFYRILRIYRNKKYDLVHINGNSYREADLIWAAKVCGIPKRLYHVHNVIPKSTWIKELVRHCVWRRSFVRNATSLLACSYPAAVTAFGEQAAANAKIIKCGIETQKYAFSEETRQATRKALGVADDVFLLGHVGRFDAQKNHEFLIDAFKAVSDRYTCVRLVLLGWGPLEEDVRRQVKKLGLEDSVIFAGVTSETEKYYCAMDLFVFPSAWEGFGIVNLEAQASGLSCVVSDQVPRQADVGHTEFLPLGDTALWAEHILRHRADKDTADRRDAWQAVRSAGYDIGDAANELHTIYTGMTRGGGTGL